MLKDLYIVMTDRLGNTALAVTCPIDSEEYRCLEGERYLLERLRSEATLGMIVEDELDGNRKMVLRDKLEKHD